MITNYLKARWKTLLVWVILPVLFAAFLVAVAKPSHAVANMSGDTPTACSSTWTVSNYGVNNGFYYLNTASKDIKVDYTLQVRRAPGCPDQYRTKVNITCTDLGVLADCVVNNIVTSFYNGSGETSTVYNEAIPSGIATRYNGWINFPGVGEVQGKGWFSDQTWVNGTHFDRTQGFYGGTKLCVRSGPAVGGQVTC